MQISKSDGRTILLQVAYNSKSYAQNIYELWLDAFERTIETIGIDTHVHGSSVVAHVLWSNMVHRVKKFAVSDSEINKKTSIVNHNRMILLVIDGKLALRFKKFDRYKLQTKNNVTDQVSKFKKQEIDLALDTEIVCIDAGYRLNSTGTSIDELFFVCPKNLEENHWAIPLHELNIIRPQIGMFDVREEDVLPVVSVKPKIAKSDEKQAG